MKLFSDCSGECAICASGGEGVCLAGHGDDDFSPASIEQIIHRLDSNEYDSYRDLMINELKSRGYIYMKEGSK